MSIKVTTSLVSITALALIEMTVSMPPATAKAVLEQCSVTVTKSKVSTSDTIAQSSMRSQISLSCPGSKGSAVEIAGGPGVMIGIGNPRNLGSCPISIAGVDAQGRLLKGNLSLYPGESRRWFHPPRGTVRIITACFSNCSGTTILEYDTPIS